MSIAKIIVSQPGKEVREVEIGGIVSVGRKDDNTISLDGDTNVSKYHAVIEPRGGEFWLSDLGSSNGTLVNDTLINAERRLRDGDVISVGGTSMLEFRAGVAPEAKQTAIVGGVPPPVMQPSPPVSVPAAPAIAALTQAPPMPAPPPGAAKLLGMPRLLVAGAAAGIVVLTATLAVLFGIGAIGGSNAKTKRAKADATTGATANRTDEDTDTLADEATDDVSSVGSSSDDASMDTASTDDSNDAAPSSVVTSAPPAVAPIATSTDAMTNMARTLAVQISQKSFYNFDPNFVLLINRHVGEYRAARGYSERARAYREHIDREFINSQGIQPPLIGYVMAFSRSKFVAGEGGVWALPIEVAREYAGDVTAADLADPAKSTRLAAAYMKSLLDLFERDNFMYAVACYGMTIDEAGKVNSELERKDPGGQARYDFWKMKNAGVVSGEQVERVARFFAAGIVGENPQQFTTGERQLSSLY